ncbi:cytochrome P450 [Mycena galericulata]|nr:cytochrome P450 [Mycena galericulata]
MPSRGCASYLSPPGAAFADETHFDPDSSPQSYPSLKMTTNLARMASYLPETSPFFRLFAIVLTFSFVLGAKSLTRFPRPPGPRGLPIVGNLFQLSEDSWHIFTAWKSKYGPVVHINIGRQEVIILNTYEAAAELLEKRSAIYSGRPRLYVAGQILTNNLFFSFLGYGDLWRKMRKAAQPKFGKDGVKDFHRIQETEAALLVRDLLQTPGGWEDHFLRTATSAVMSATYGTSPVKSTTEPMIVGILEFTQAVLRAAFVDSALVDGFPLFEYLPAWLAPWKRDAQRASTKFSQLFDTLYDEAKVRATNGDTGPSLATSLVRREDSLQMSDKQLAWIAAAFAAGSETLSSTMGWLLLAILNDPRVQEKAHRELDKVVGRDRPPTIADMGRMPYIKALIRETLRWHPADPLGFQHRSTEDDWYDGKFIRKGTICIPNIWAINRDPKIYGDDAHLFRPERYLDVNGELAPIQFDTNKEEGHVTFGFGRRVCIGKYFALDNLFINVATTLWMFDIRRTKDLEGRPIIPNEETVNIGLAVQPAPFKCVFARRFSEAPAILETIIQDRA